MAVTSKNRRKAREALKETRVNWLLWNGDLSRVKEDGLEKAFPKVEDRINYLQALINDFTPKGV